MVKRTKRNCGEHRNRNKWSRNWVSRHVSINTNKKVLIYSNFVVCQKSKIENLELFRFELLDFAVLDITEKKFNVVTNGFCCACVRSVSCFCRALPEFFAGRLNARVIIILAKIDSYAKQINDRDDNCTLVLIVSIVFLGLTSFPISSLES